MELYKKENISMEVKKTFFSSPGAGGQKKNKTNVGVRLTHLETGITVQNEDTRSMKQNEKLAIEELCKRLSEHYTKLNREIYREKF